MTKLDWLNARSRRLIWTAGVLVALGLVAFVWNADLDPQAGWFALVSSGIASMISAVHSQRSTKSEPDDSLDRDEQLWMLASALPLFLYRCQNDPHWITLFVSDGCEAVTGYPSADFVSGKVRYNELIDEAYRDFVRERWQEGLDANKPVDIDYPIRTASGEERWVCEKGHGVYDDQGTLIYLQGIVVDITDRKVAEKERDLLLQEADQSRRVLLSVLEDERRGQAERLRLILAIEQAGESFVMTDTEGVIQYVNPAFTRCSGYTREEALGQHTRLLKSGKHPEDLYDELWETISSGRAWKGRLVNRRKDGSLFTEDATISAVTDAAGHITNYVAVNRDVTHEIELEEQLFQAQKMELIGRMVGGIAHDFNNNLQAILGFADIAMDDHADSKRLKEYLSEILKAGESASALTRQLLAFSRRQVLSKQPVEMNVMLAEMLNMIDRTVSENVVIDWQPNASTRYVNGDRHLLEQVMLNLVVNARDAMPEGGRLSIKLSDVELSDDDLAMHPDARTGRFIRLTVTDTGIGIPVDIRSKIFEPFFTTKPASQGTGLGLSMVYGIIKQHEGWVSVYSEVDKGTEFHLYIPLSDHEVEEVADPTIVRSDDPIFKGQGERILVVEDEAGILDLIQRILSNAGYEVVAAATAEDGIHCFERDQGRFDMVISDVVLPGKSGFDMVEHLQSDNPNLKVLLISGYSDERTRWSNIQQNGWRYLPKSVNRRVLLSTLREVLTG